MQNSVDHSSSDADSPAGSPSRKPTASSSKSSSRQPQASSSKHEAVKAPSEVVSTTPQANPSRHERFWFHDGSVILHVESKLFRVHQTILANYSEVFAGLFEMPQPNGDSMLEGCHIVELHDSEKDFEDLLHAVYNPSYFDTLSPTADIDAVLAFIAGILRLSTKYLMRNLRNRCISLFTSKFPSTFDDYAAKSTSAAHERYRSDSVMRAIQLARETTVLEVLPYAYYCVARMSMKRIMKEREDDLSWKEKCLCLVGRERLRWAEMSVSHSFLLVFQRSTSCVTFTCAHTRGPHAEWHVLEAAKSPNPLRAFTRWSNLNICKECEVHCQRVHLQGRKEVWTRLPGFFDLPPWEVLKQAQNE
ncbi:hypothetical protein FA13DRAFT_1698124 [Coprinellus micaceus]|uniref:BTB domain-containing protein n=1 Tax=Coprinellus micaceus TaxID=71717 RepID=A0A4Y7SCA6_COPMI|nr:hypothetical protein FA13DRAFT_1698124 [Coprinellus micaceus]